MVTIRREMGIQRKNQKEMLEIKNTITEMNAFDGFISILDTTEGKKINEHEEMFIETSKLKCNEKNK